MQMKNSSAGSIANGPARTPGDDRVAIAGEVPEHRQDDDRADDIIAGIDRCRPAPSLPIAVCAAKAGLDLDRRTG